MTTTVPDHSGRIASATERPGPRPDVAEGAYSGLEDLPPLPDPTLVDAADARALSKTLFARLDSLEEGTPEYSYVRNSLVELNLALVRYAVGRMRVREESREDVVQVGTIGLIKAINRFDPTRGIEFPTFAVPTIVGEIKRFYRDTSWAVRVPRRLQELRIDLNKATADLEQTHGRSPTVAELADHLGLDEEEILEGMVATNGYSAASLDAPADENDAEGALAHHVGQVDHALEKVEELEAIKPYIAALPERSRTILALRFSGDMTQSEIGERLGISQMHVSRLLARTLDRIRAQVDVPD